MIKYLNVVEDQSPFFPYIPLITGSRDKKRKKEIERHFLLEIDSDNSNSELLILRMDDFKYKT